ncbi:hypothetical protein PQX77_021414, partial [Marasmius sp. AFHP31]
ANILHNVLAALVDAWGTSKNALTDASGTSGNVVFLNLLVKGLALQPCSPTFPSARDAIIQADQDLYGGKNKCLLWKTFASRGLGDGAVRYRDSFAVPKECQDNADPLGPDVRSKDPIKPSTENALMVVTTGNEHAGKLVRRIRTFYLGAKEEDYHWVVGGVISKGESGKESLTDELLELHPGFHLVRVRESARQRAEGNKYMDDVRKEARKEWSHRVELHVPVLRTDGCMKSTVVTLSHDKCDGCDVRALAKYRATRRDAFSNSAPQAHKFPLPFLPPFPNASYSHTTIIPFMPANRSPPSRSSRSTGPIRATERQSRRSPEPERSREEPRLTRRQRERQRQLKEAFDKWSSGILEGSTPAQGALQAFYNVGAYWNRFIDPFTDDIELVLRFGFTEELKGPLTDDDDDDVVMNPAVDEDDEIEDEDEDEDEETEEERKQRLATLDLFARPDELKESEKKTYREWFAMFKTTFPTQYKQLLNSYKYEASATLKALYRSINSGFNASRRNDTSNLKKAILSYLPLNPQQTAIKDDALDPFISATAKSNRGLNHPMIIPMLAPIERVMKMYDKPADDPVRAKLIEDGKSKKIELNPHLLPGFLYDFSRLKMDKEKDGRAGVFRGYLIVRACRGLLTSPSSALGDGEKKATRAGVAKRLGITEITDRYLAYVIWFALSDVEQWGPVAGSFELKTFYYTVIKTIAKLHPRRRELAFEFLNNEIFGRDAKAKLVPDNSPLGMMFASWEDEDEEDIDAEEAAAAASSDDHSPPPGSDGSGGSGDGFDGSGGSGDGGSGDGDSGDGSGGSGNAA